MSESSWTMRLLARRTVLGARLVWPHRAGPAGLREGSPDGAPNQSLPGAGAGHKGWRTGVSQLPITGGQATVTRRQAPTVTRLIREKEPTREASGENCERTPAAGAATRGREQLGGEAYEIGRASCRERV